MPVFHGEIEVDSFDGSQTWEVVADSPEHAAEIFNKGGGKLVCEEVEVLDLADVTAADFYEVAESEIVEDEVPTPNDGLEARALAELCVDTLAGACTCTEGYVIRNKRDPGCEYCNIGAFILPLAHKIIEGR